MATTRCRFLLLITVFVFGSETHILNPLIYPLIDKDSTQFYYAYVPVKNNRHLRQRVEDRQRLTLSPVVQAEGIYKQYHTFTESTLTECIYNIFGRKATSFQFYETDSISVFSREHSITIKT